MDCSIETSSASQREANADSNGKPLCDKHHDLVLAEDPKVVTRSRAKIGLKPHAVIHGRSAKWEEFEVMCAVKGCGGGTTYWVEGKIPVCPWHLMGMADLEKLDLRTEIAYIKSSSKRNGARSAEVEIPDAPAAELLAEPSSESGQAAADADWESRLASGEFD